jgi:hypothetical protein
VPTATAPPTAMPTCARELAERALEEEAHLGSGVLELEQSLHALLAVAGSACRRATRLRPRQ